MGDVIKDFYKSDAPQFKGRSKEKRREMAIAAKLTAERGPQNEAATEVAMSPAELALQKKKTMIDKMITMKRQQALGKTKTEEVEKSPIVEGDGDPCWDTHKQVGMKKKGGKMVPNCVPKEETVVEKKGDGNLANNYPPYDKVTRADIIAGAKGEDQMGGKKNIRGNDSKEQKARLEKKRGMKLDDHPQFKEELEATGKFTAQEIEAIIDKL